MNWVLRLILWFDGGGSLPDGQPLVGQWDQDSPPAVWSRPEHAAWNEETRGEWNRVS